MADGVPHLLLRLEAPLMSFGTVAVDARRPVQRWPAVSMLTGLLANALGWRRTQAAQLDRLQARLRWAARIDRPGTPLTDFQTAQLDAADKGWTTLGRPEGRAGGADTYKSPHIRWRDYRADASVLVALRLQAADEAPTLAELQAALDAPLRPLFIGRKGCPPATRVCAGLVDAADAVAALVAAAPAAGEDAAAPAVVFFGADAVGQLLPTDTRHAAADERRFALDVHAGRQWVYERRTAPAPP